MYGGDGLARLDGRVVLTPFVLPGERVRVEPWRSKPDLVRGRAVEVLERAAQRVEPGCPYFRRCGGCHYQHAAYEYQLEQKQSILRDVLRRVGKIEFDGEVGLRSGEAWGYRNRSQFHIQRGKIGYLEAGSHRLCPVDRCPISSPKIGEGLGMLREMVRERRWPRFVRSIELFTNEAEVQVNVIERDRPVARHFFDWCAERIPGATVEALNYAGLRVSPGTFFQVNRFLVDALVSAALEGAGGDSAADLYAGAGLFSIPMACRFREVTAVEPAASAFRDLEFNSKGAIALRKQSAEEYLSGLDRAPDFLLVDPPRAGLGKDVVQQILRLKPPKITIVACDPATLARDLARLGTSYRIERLVLVDLFPQTYHFETVASLSI